MEKNYNEDYIKGMKFLLEKSREQGINIRKVQWIPNVSKLLSERNLCYEFWYNVWKQDRLDRTLLCKTWYDVIYGIDECLFCWARTRQGMAYWYVNLYKMLGVTGDDSEGKLQNIKL
jgi:hypothetical protein